MHFKTSIILCFTIFSFHFNGAAQDIPIGSWRHHADYSDVKAIQAIGNKLFGLASQGLFYYDLEYESINTLSTVDGLSGIQPTAIAANLKNEELIVGYKNGAIDFISDDFTLSSFLNIETSSIYSDKKINAFAQSGDVLYVATDFGVVILSLSKKQIIDTYENLGVNGNNLSIKHIYFLNNFLYLSTESGVLKGTINNTLNLKDFKNWDRYIISDTTTVLESLIYNDLLYCRTADHAIYQLNSNNSWTKLLDSAAPITSLFLDENRLKYSAGKQIFELKDTQFEVIVNLNQGGIIQDFTRLNGQAFIAHNIQSLAAISGNDIVQSYRPGGPAGNASKIIQIEGFTIFLPEQTRGFSYFENGIWRSTENTKTGSLLPILNDASLDFISGNVIFLSANEGIYSWDTREVSQLTVSNTAEIMGWKRLSTAPDGTVWALVITANNLAFLNTQTSELSISNISSNTTINDYLIAPNGDHYLSTTNGLVAYNIQEAVSRTLINNIGNGNLPSTKITDLALDLSGNMWIGTQNGICYLSNYSNVFSGGDVNATVPIFEGFFLFQGININSIQVDGGNRLWVGNRDGLWVFDENIQQNIMRFTTNNSPLRVNKIDQHIINPLNGEVFMLNQGQLLSYRSASSRAKENLDQVKIFPNPVSLSRDNRMSIDGLTNNMEVMITDLAGNLIYKNMANGGTFSWELSNYSGFKIKPGIYLVFSVDNFGDKSYKGKFVVTK